MVLQREKNIVIDKQKEQEPALDFAFLKAKGIELIQQYTGENWTDFNLHDPGVTILEYLCYALTDVAYRTTFPIADILADKKGQVNPEKNFFFSKQEVLSSSPVTVNDYRKLLIDSVPEIGNIWLEPVTSSFSPRYSRGIYHVIIQPSPGIIHRLTHSDVYTVNGITENLIRTVKEILLAHRNIGEHYETFQVLQPRPVYIKAELIIERSASPRETLSEIYQALDHVLNPRVVLYTEAELLAKGYAVEDIYSGPLLQNGIIRDEELKNRITELDPFILTKAVSKLKGIVSIRRLLVSEDGLDYHNRVLKFKDGFFPFVAIDDLHPQIVLFHDTYPLYVPKEEALKKEQVLRRKPVTSLAQKTTGIQLKGEYKSLHEYISIQTLFPSIYGISEEGPQKNHPPAGIAKSRQLKAYLMLFEQLLANSLSQLANISKLFSTDTSAGAASTYYFQPLYNVPDAKYILKAFTNNSASLSAGDWEDFTNDPANGFVRSVDGFMETDEQYKDRKKRAFDHILARFNIAVHKHPIFLYEFYYDRENPGRRTDIEVRWKASILSHIPAFTSDRIKADNYLSLLEDEGLENGFGKKMSLLLHIRNHSRRRLSKVVDKYRKQLSVTEPAEHEQEETTLRYRDEQLNIVLGSHVQNVEEQSPVSHHVTFTRQPELLFQSAIDSSNYRIVPYRTEGKAETVLLFKQPQEPAWNMLSKHPDEYAAVKALTKTIHLFKEISIESEGFYVLEHLLLKPSLQAQRFGFYFTDSFNNSLLQQRDWLSFAQREETITALLEIAAAYSPENDYTATLDLLREVCTFSGHLLSFSKKQGKSHKHEQPGKDAVQYLMHNLREFAVRSTAFYPAFEYTVQQPDEPEISEDFFNFRMTVVLPSWPARFHDKGFRELAENMFREECPAHIKVSFLWLNLSAMKTFDDLYFDWLRAIKSGTDDERSQLLIRFLVKNGVRSNVANPA